MTHPDATTAKVAAVNNAHAYGAKLYAVLAEFFRPYVGQKIENADGSIPVRIKKLMPAFPDADLPEYRLMVHRHLSNYSLAWTIRTCEQSPPPSWSNPALGAYPTSHSYDVTVYVGNMRNGVLSDIYKAPDHRWDYTPEGVLAARQALRAAQEKVSEAKAALWPFGESYD